MKIVNKPGRGVGRTTEAAEYAKKTGAYVVVVDNSTKQHLLEKGYEQVLTHRDVLEGMALLGKGDVSVVFDDAEALLRRGLLDAGVRVRIEAAFFGGEEAKDD